MAISVDTREESVEFAEDLEIPFPLLRDADLAVANAYGVAMLGDELAIPATFVITRGGTIRWRTIGETMADRPDFDELMRQLEPNR